MDTIFTFANFRLDAVERLLFSGVSVITLPPKVFDTLLMLVKNAGHVLSKEKMLAEIWDDSFVEENNLAQNISHLRRVLGETDDVKLIETVPKYGYRFVAEVSIDAGSELRTEVFETSHGRIYIHDGSGDEQFQGLSVPAARLPAKKTRGYYILAAGVILAFAFAVTLYYFTSSENAKAQTPQKPRALAILPFRNLRPDAATDFLGSSMADSITSKLGNIHMLVVRPSSAVEKYRNQEIDPRTVANELNVDKLLTGSFLKDGDDLRVTTQLIDVNANGILWNGMIDMKYDKVLAMEDRVAEEIIKGLRLNLSPLETDRLKMDAPQNPLAYESFLRGRYLISSNEHTTAIKLLEESVRLDPNYALAWTYLGKAYSVNGSQYFGGREFHDKAQAAYDKAIALNPQQVETRVLLANFLTENDRVEEAVPILRKALDENPNHPFAHWELSYAYRYAGMLDESITEGENALQIYAHLTGHLFNSYMYAGQYEKFLTSLPTQDKAYTLFYRGLGNYYLKDWTHASVYFDRAYQLDPSALVSQLGHVFRLTMDGHNREAIELLRSIDSKLEQDSFEDGELTYKLAQAYSLLGDNKSALRLLEKSTEQGFFCYPYFTSDPLLNNLRRESQYATLIEQSRQRHEQFKRKFF